MTTATATTLTEDRLSRLAPEPEPAVKRGFGACCPKCGEPGYLRLDLDDVRNLACTNCDGEFTTDDVRAIVADWLRLLAWLDTAPACD